MSGQQYADYRVQCPFFRRQDRLYVRCEGLTRRGSLTVRFARAAEKTKWMQKRCESIAGCQECPVYQMLVRVLDVEE